MMYHRLTITVGAHYTIDTIKHNYYTSECAEMSVDDGDGKG